MGVVRDHTGVEAVEDSTCPSFQAWSHSSFSEPLAGLRVGTRSWPSGLTSPWWYLVIGWPFSDGGSTSVPYWVTFCPPSPSCLVTSVAPGQSGMLFFTLPDIFESPFTLPDSFESPGFIPSHQ